MLSVVVFITACFKIQNRNTIKPSLVFSFDGHKTEKCYCIMSKQKLGHMSSKLWLPWYMNVKLN